MQWFTNFYYEGGYLFMNIISIVGILMFLFMILRGLGISNNMIQPAKSQKLMKEASILALVLGILGQLIGLYSAMVAIAAQGGVSMQILASGIRVSSNTTLYGFFFFVIARIAYIYFTFSEKKEA
ncbi:hypothetical protein EI427_13910 [Flammeovirga pectinis]|uniref:MotA/TolQ/ExbB proton channel domain-containing protein n=1 Tax=Flammeovirga pectinis TaxID=2494373 RepID=A0A3Q9FPC9_9BACT|nr:MotA/TolQ/ExbB proton channel family protein [Flammeovirga pectinis]AZQ63294.1 hypothetical protein EI427_13910 [Flammeovirga pectinis]